MITTDTRAAVYDIVLGKLTSPNYTEEQIQTAINETGAAIRIYTNRMNWVLQSPSDIYDYEPLPPEMAFIWANMAFDLLAGSQAEQTSSGTPAVAAGAINGAIKSIREGDVTVEFSNGETAATGAATDPTARISALMYNYESQLQAFRRLGW